MIIANSFRISFALVQFACADDDDQTSVTDQLNGFIASSDLENGWYTGGKGVIVRAPDFISGGDEQVVPASFWSNDIYSPSQLYPGSGNIWFPNDGSDGYGDITFQTPQEPSGDAGPWTFASVGAVVGTSMSILYPNFDNIQDADWGWGVFYATDSNSVDQRCIYWDDNNGWDCPGGWLDASGNFDTSTGSKGSGSYYMGNPDVYGLGGGGGGAGCHFGTDHNLIDQPDSSDHNSNLVGDANCQCNYGLNGNDWNDWLNEFVTRLKQKDSYAASRPWLNGGGALAPGWAMDSSICWVNNPRDLIMLQNQLHWNRESWNNQRVPLSDWGSGETSELRKYWGWNEIPVDRDIVEDPANWDAVVVKLPADICQNNFGSWDSVWCLGSTEQWDLENQLDQFVQNGKLVPGAENVGSRPGSYVVFAREWGQTWENSLGSSRNHTLKAGSKWSGVNWQRWFFCEEWWSPGGKYHIVHMPQSDDPDGNGACYIEWANPAPVYNPNAIVHIASGKCIDVENGDVSNGNHVIVSNCDGGDSQGWWFDGWTLVAASNNDMCVDIVAGDISCANTLQLWECNGLPQQSFGYDESINSIYAASSTDASLCLDAQNGGNMDGSPVWLWDCNQLGNQIFDVSRAHAAAIFA